MTGRTRSSSSGKQIPPSATQKAVCASTPPSHLARSTLKKPGEPLHNLFVLNIRMRLHAIHPEQLTQLLPQMVVGLGLLFPTVWLPLRVFTYPQIRGL